MSALAFAAPLALAALVALPVLYYLLRLTPPPPRRLPLPTLPLVKDILGREREPARTPWWLLVLRLAAAAALILAAAGPRWQPDAAGQPPGSGQLMLLIDDGWAAGGDWKTRIDKATALINNAANRPILLVAASEERPQSAPEPARAALARLNSLSPKPWRVSRETMFEAADAALRASSDLSIVWISDGSTIAAEAPRIAQFIADAGGRLSVVTDAATNLAAIPQVLIDNDGLEATLVRLLPEASSRQGLYRAFDEKGRILGEATFSHAPGAREAKARLTLPLELMNEIARLEIADARHAGAVHLLDAANRRRRVALVSGETTDTAQPLVSARYFVARALQPFSDLREPPRGTVDPVARALEERPDILVLVDIGTVGGETGEAIGRFVENGGMLIRFAGPGLAAASDDLLPVRLRRGGRILGGALSWDKPQKLAAFPENSPFQGLAPRDEIRVERQVLAEPDSELTRASWAVLEDGTPLVTGSARGRGQIVLFHVTGDTSWSNLPLSGVFVDMLRRTLQLSASRGGAGQLEGERGREKLQPRLTLDGFGVLTAPSATARAVEARHVAPASADHPPGLYGPAEASLAVNTLSIAEPFQPIAFTGIAPQPLNASRALEFRPWLMIFAALLLLADLVIVALLALGGLRALARLAPRTAGLAMLMLAGALLLAATPALAQTPPAPPNPPPSPEDMRSSLKPRLAYVVTGNVTVDEASRAGLFGLGQILAQRTSVNLDEPIGLNPERDELVFYSMLYWPILPDQPRPPEAAIKAIDSFMKNGGTIIFDTRDAFVQRGDGQPTPETRALRRMLASLDIPSLEPVPPDHVLTKTFYLLDRMIGRYMTGDTWVEALSGPRDAKTPARAGDRVSPIIITSNDLAAAWAVDRLGRPLFPLVPGDARQREMALRTGVNLVMYVFTGNYKTDQVHVPALLERLGQ